MSLYEKCNDIYHNRYHLLQCQGKILDRSWKAQRYFFICAISYICKRREKMKTRRMFLSFFILIGCMCAQTMNADEPEWPRWRGPNGDGISQETDWDPEALAGAPKILWNVNIGGGYSNVVIKDNRLYTMGIAEREGVVYCLDAETGEEIWRYAYGAEFEMQSTPTIDGKYVYALSTKGILMCLKAKNGKPRWKKDLVSEYNVTKPFYGFAGSPVIEGDLVFLTANTSGFALDKNTGEKVWGSEKPPENLRIPFCTGPHYATPVHYDYKGKRYIIVTSYKGVYSVDVETGKHLWVYGWETPRSSQIADPLIFHNKVFIAQYGREHGCVLLDIGGGDPKVIWENFNMHSEISSPVMIDGYIYGIDGGPDYGFDSLLCLDADTGDVMWEENLIQEGKLRELKSVSLMAADGKLIILCDNGALHIAEANPSSYREISGCTLPGVKPGKKEFKQYWTPPVLCGGRIYCRNNFGNLVCIDVRK
jgi:outer membrane protein assembly factor BamB